jgi:hypothetical protein
VTFIRASERGFLLQFQYYAVQPSLSSEGVFERGRSQRPYIYIEREEKPGQQVENRTVPFIS